MNMQQIKPVRQNTMIRDSRLKTDEVTAFRYIMKDRMKCLMDVYKESKCVECGGYFPHSFLYATDITLPNDAQYFDKRDTCLMCEIQIKRRMN